MTDDEQPPSYRKLFTDINNEALSQPVPRLVWWRRLIAWFKAHAAGGAATNGGYWGGVTMWDRLKAAAARATAFLRR